jgi:hypothetical protein
MCKVKKGRLKDEKIFHPILAAQFPPRREATILESPAAAAPRSSLKKGTHRYSYFPENSSMGESIGD